MPSVIAELAGYLAVAAAVAVAYLALTPAVRARRARNRRARALRRATTHAAVGCTVCTLRLESEHRRAN